MSDRPLGGGHFNSDLPLLVNELACRCDLEHRSHDYGETWGATTVTYKSNGNVIHGVICYECGKPLPHSVQYLYRICDSCDNYFIPDLDSIPYWPPPYLLCKDCDVPTPVLRSGRTNFRFS